MPASGPACLLACLLLLAPMAASQPVVNEFLSSNLDGLLDEDGNSSDWIEIHNPGIDAIDLNGWSLSDDEDEPLKWTFEETFIPADGHLLIFASGEDRRQWPGYFRNVINWGEEWFYRANYSDAPPTGWQSPGFDDSAWSFGPTGIGYGDDDDATIVHPCISVSMRRGFIVPDPAEVRSIVLHVDYDDGFAVWLNGHEILRVNLSTEPDETVEWDHPAAGQHEAVIWQGGMPEGWILESEATDYLLTGENILAIETHNLSGGSSDMTMIPFLTLALASNPPGPGSLPEILLGVLPRLHTNFKLDAAGETLLLSNPSGQVVESVQTGRMYVDISRGRSPDGGSSWSYFTPPTPEAPNGTGYAGLAASPTFQTTGGYKDAAFDLSIMVPESTQVCYSYGGKLPVAGADSCYVYTSPIPVAETCVIRARAFQDGKLPSPTATASFIFEEVPTLPTVSLSTDPFNLWDSEYGIHVLGDDYYPEQPFWGANFWEDWERPVFVEMFESDGSTAFAMDAGVKISGGWTRSLDQKSLSLLSRGGYGSDRFPYAVFDEKPMTSYRQLMLRNSGNDYWNTRLRDGLMQRLIAHVDIDRQAFRPARVYLNGEYWGLMNLRERKSASYLADNHGIDPDAVDILEIAGSVVDGSADHYENMISMIETYGVVDSANYAWVKTQMDVTEFSDYNVAQIFFANTDWPGNNIRFWRPQTADGIWRWILYDTDFGLGLVGDTWHNTLAFALDDEGPGWPNPPWSTFLLRALMENMAFRNDFINRFADHLNSSFLPARTVPMLNSISGEIEAEIPRHSVRWGTSASGWYDDLGIVRDFLHARSEPMRLFIQDEFNLPGLYTLNLDVEPAGAGRIDLTAVGVDSTWSGIYFRDVPVTLRAAAFEGWHFSGWSDPALPAETSVTIDPTGDYAVTALFEEGGAGSVMINEINYNSADSFDAGDWVELHNSGPVAVDIGDWVFKDSDNDHAFTIPTGTTLPGGGFLVLCNDSTSFRNCFPTEGPILGDLNFGFSGSGEMLRLYDHTAAMLDFVNYSDSPPWPTEPDGGGPTLELADPDSDNTLPASWAASIGHGTPGQINSAALTDGGGQALPALALLPNWPNPFNPRTMVAFDLPVDGPVSLAVYDISGRRASLLHEGALAAGRHEFVWDGCDENGVHLASGIYLLRLDANGELQTRKMTLLR